MNIVVRTLPEQVFDIVRDQIVSGRLPDSMPIRQDALANELGISKIPLREALARLEQEGLIVSQANRGYFVRPMTAEEADDIFALRLSIEPDAASHAAARAGAEERMLAETALETLIAAAPESRGEIAIRSRAFRMALVRPGGRLLTVQLVERLAILSERYVHAYLAPSGGSKDAGRAILSAWLARDGAETAALIGAQIRRTRDDLRVRLGSEAAA